MKSKVKHAVLTLALAVAALGATAFSTPRRTVVVPRPRYYVVRPYYYNPYWYDPFWYGSSWYAPPVYTVPRYLQGTIKTEIEPKNAEVYVDGGYVGTADKFRGVFHGLNLRPGTYQLEFRAPNYQPLAMKVYVVADKTLKLKLHLRPQMR
jgi:hypothetical protein